MASNRWAEKRFYTASGAEAGPGWLVQGSARYRIGSDGSYLSGRHLIDGTYYHFWSTGPMIVDRWWGGRYYASDGKEAGRGWLSIGSAWYYIKSDYTCVVGRMQIGSSYYYFWSNGQMASNRWWNGHYYQSSGAMATNQWIGDVWVDGNGDVDPAANDAIMGSSKVTATQMANAYIRTVGANAYPYKGNPIAPTIYAFCDIFMQEADMEGVRADVAFAQSMLETNWLRFTGVCKPEQFNFAGLGALDGGGEGAYFKDIRTGIRAQIQHLKAYASTAPLVNACVDPRFGYVKRGCAPIIQWLGIQENPNGYGWASGAGYGNKITRIMQQVEGK